MNKIAQCIVGATAAVLLLAGCSAVSAEAQGVPSDAPSTASSDASPAPAPIAMSEAPEAPKSAAQEAGFKDENDWYLRSIKSSWTGDMPDDEQLLAAGTLACDELAKGTPRDQVHAVVGSGEAAVNNNQNLIGYAVMALCP